MANAAIGRDESSRGIGRELTSDAGSTLGTKQKFLPGQVVITIQPRAQENRPLMAVQLDFGNKLVKDSSKTLTLLS